MEKLYSRVFCISERMFVAESITMKKKKLEQRLLTATEKVRGVG
jgi:hypothetical protein